MLAATVGAMQRRGLAAAYGKLSQKLKQSAEAKFRITA
jgi:hypothetical protein